MPIDHDKAGQGASPFRAYLRGLTDDIARAREDGLPVVLRVDAPLRPHAQQLMDTLGVEVELVTAAAVNRDVRVVAGVGGSIVVMGAWCSSCRQEAMVNDAGACTWCGRTVVDFDRLNSQDLAAQLRAGATTQREGASMAQCKVEGCENDAADRAGLYARMCEMHKQEARAARAQGQPPPRSSRSAGGTLAEQARDLVPLARALERARAQLESLPSSASAKASFDEATRRASQTPTPENLARVAEATKQLQTFAPKRTKLESAVAHAERDLGQALRAFSHATLGARAA